MSADPRPPAPLEPVEIVNLTPHDVAVIQDDGSRVVLPRSDHVARVLELDTPAAPLQTPEGEVPLRVVTRKEDVYDLPHPCPNTRYLVSRITADALPTRDDLVFPYGELRDDAGQIVGVRSLGVLPRPPTRAVPVPLTRRQQWRRQLDLVLRRATVTSLCLAIGTGLGGVTGGVLADRLQDGAWSDEARWVLAGFTITTIVFLLAGAYGLRLQLSARTRRGTGYLIDEPVLGYTIEHTRAFADRIRETYRSAFVVPGPAELEGFPWQLQPGTPAWGPRCDTLVQSFLVLLRNDDAQTHNTVFVRAPWAVAFAFGAKVVAARRNLVLRVGMWPSDARTGPHPGFIEDPLTFPGTNPVAVGVERPPVTARLSISGSPAASATSDDGGAGRAAGSAPFVIVLVVRTNHNPWGPLPRIPQRDPITGVMPDEPAPADELALRGSVSGGPVPDGAEATLLEWRCLPPDGSQQHPREDFETIAEAAARWIVAVSRKYSGATILLGTAVPVPVAVGLGIWAKRLEERPPERGWPESLTPIVYAPDRVLSIPPGLDIGTRGFQSPRAQPTNHPNSGGRRS